MASTAVVRARIDRRLKEEAEAALATLGFTLSGAFRLMLTRVAQDKALPFAPILPNRQPVQRKRNPDVHNVTRQMRGHATMRTHDHFGFLGLRAAIACLYARPEGATQQETNQVAAALNSPQEGWINMLHQSIKWGHSVVSWDDPVRGRVHKLIYNPAHSARSKMPPPANWKNMNASKTPPGTKPAPFVGRRTGRQALLLSAKGNQ